MSDSIDLPSSLPCAGSPDSSFKSVLPRSTPSSASSSPAVSLALLAELRSSSGLEKHSKDYRAVDFFLDRTVEGTPASTRPSSPRVSIHSQFSPFNTGTRRNSVNDGEAEQDHDRLVHSADCSHLHTSQSTGNSPLPGYSSLGIFRRASMPPLPPSSYYWARQFNGQVKAVDQLQSLSDSDTDTVGFFPRPDVSSDFSDPREPLNGGDWLLAKAAAEAELEDEKWRREQESQ